MSSTLKLLSALTILTLSSYGADVDKKQLLRYMNDAVIKNPDAKAIDVEIYESREPKELKGWSALFTKMKIDFKGEKVDVPELIFIKDGLATSTLVDLNTRKDYSSELKPTVQTSMYDAHHLLAGNSNAKHKIILFSDPLCPFCREVFPRMIKAVKAHPEVFALYYYHMPLTRIHPGVETLTRIMILAQQDKKLDVIEKIYAMQLHVNPKDPKAIIDAVAKETGYSVSLDQINSKKVNDALQKDKDAALHMMVGGTPTVYLDGKWDKIRETYMNYIPKK
jgi:thiol:disulfide interchange protein DsbC